MPNLFARLKRKSNSHKSAEATSSKSAPSSPTSLPSPTRPPRADHVPSPVRASRPSLDVEDVPPRTTSLHDSTIDRTDADLTQNLQKLALSDTSTASSSKPPQLPPLPFDSKPNPPVQPTTLEQQRNALVDEIASEAKANKAEGLSDAGRAVFVAAGLEKEANTGSTLEVETRYMKPVIQETIIVKEHTEITTVVDTHIHRHHVYPKIQPISDPNPILLEPRHRIFSAFDGKWHEVIGDAAAIAILGEDVFYNGPKEVREDRKMALPGLGGEVDERAFEARVVEREGVKGEELGSWRQVKGLAGLEVETPSKMIGEGWMVPEEDLGPVQRTVGIAL